MTPLMLAMSGTDNVDNVWSVWKEKLRECILRGRRKSSQKLAKRRTYVWGGGGGGLDRLRKASFKKEKKIEQYADNGRCASPGPDANRLEPNKEILLEQIRII